MCQLKKLGRPEGVEKGRITKRTPIFSHFSDCRSEIYEKWGEASQSGGCFEAGNDGSEGCERRMDLKGLDRRIHLK